MQTAPERLAQRMWLVVNSYGYRDIHLSDTDVHAIQEGMAETDYVLSSKNWQSTPVNCYALVNRPPALGAVPGGWVHVGDRPKCDQPHHHIARHGIIAYLRALTDEETRQFELAPIITDIKPLVACVVNDIAEYADGYVEALEACEIWAKGNVLRRIEELSKGYAPSVPDPDAFVAAVLVALKDRLLQI